MNEEGIMPRERRYTPFPNSSDSTNCHDTRYRSGFTLDKRNILQTNVLQPSPPVSGAGYIYKHRHREVQPSSPSPSELSPSISQSTRNPAPLAQVAAMSGSTMCHVEFSWARYHLTSSVARATTCLIEGAAASNMQVIYLDSCIQKRGRELGKR